jgi:iron complex transport system substrate-binding protein
MRLLPVARCALVALLAVACSRTPSGTVRDDAGRLVAAPRTINRVVTLAPNLTEIVFAIGAGSKIVAADDFSDTPPLAQRLTKVGGIPPNVERIAAARPDLVIALSNGGYAAYAPALAALRIPLYIVKTDRMDDVPRAMLTLGKVLGAEDAGRAAAALRRDVDQQRRTRAHPPRVMFAIWIDPFYVAGLNTFANNLLSLAGARNVVQLQGWPQYSVESLVANPPDLLLYPDKSVKRSAVDALFGRYPELRGRTVAVPVDENRFTRPGPRLAEAAAELNRILDSWEAGERAMLHATPEGRR